MDKRLKIFNKILILTLLSQIVFAQRMRDSNRDLKTSNVEQFHITIVPEADTKTNKILLKNLYI